MSAQKTSFTETLLSLTGYDEIAIEKHMEVDLYTEADTKPLKAMRAVAFVLKRRDGMNDTEAKDAVMSMSVSEVQDLFADEEDVEVEIDGEAPLTESGEGFAPSE